MIKQGEDELICDLAETYHIYNYRSLPLSLVATLAVGLRDDSRIKLKLNKQHVSNTDLLLAVIADRLGLILSFFTGEPIEHYFVEGVFDDIKKPQPKGNDLIKFGTAEEFERARNKLLRRE